jgi:hypothetical protein
MLRNTPNPSVIEHLRCRPRLVAGLSLVVLITVVELLLVASVLLVVGVLAYWAN